MFHLVLADDKKCFSRMDGIFDKDGCFDGRHLFGLHSKPSIEVQVGYMLGNSILDVEIGTKTMRYKEA